MNALRIRARLQPCREVFQRNWALAPEGALAGAEAQVSYFADSARLKSCPDTNLQRVYEMNFSIKAMQETKFAVGVLRLVRAKAARTRSA
jgi:hypothetical protein